MQEKEFAIGGMYCPNCEKRITRALKALPGVHTVRVSYQTGVATVMFDPNQVALKELYRTVEALDYTILPDAATSDMSRAVSLLTIIIALYVLLQRFGLLNLLVPSQLAGGGMGYGMLFIVGVLTSVHCVAMCGGISLSQSIGRGFASGPLLYNAGRVAAYTFIGGVLGLLGGLLGTAGGVGISTLIQGLLKIVAGTFMVIMGVNMLGVFPWLLRLTPRLPALPLRLQGKGHLLIGLLNGFMPCGPLQSIQIVAFASGSFLTGALSMLAFGLGTVPLMLGLGALVTTLGKRFAHTVQQMGAVLVAVLGLAMLAQGGALSGMLLPDRLLLLVILAAILGVAVSLPRRQGLALAATAVLVLGVGRYWLYTRARAPVSTSAMLVDGIQVVSSTLEPGSYPNISVQADIPVQWTINAPPESINGCNYRMVLQALGLEYTFTEGENIIEFTPQTAGTISYSCWMGMIQGSITVTERG